MKFLRSSCHLIRQINFKGFHFFMETLQLELSLSVNFYKCKLLQVQTFTSVKNMTHLLKNFCAIKIPHEGFLIYLLSVIFPLSTTEISFLKKGETPTLFCMVLSGCINAAGISLTLSGVLHSL